MKKNYRIALIAILCALAISMGFLESLIPPIAFLPPGAKLGFSNIITMFAAGSLGLPYALTIALVKGLFTFITRGATAGFMSLSGGLLSSIAMYFLMKYAKKHLGLIGISVICAICHNFGQLAAARIITQTPTIYNYAPALAIFGIIMGAVTGIVLKAVLPALEKIKKHFI